MRKLSAVYSFPLCAPFMSVDLECEKISGGFKWASGEVNSKRWKPFMASLALVRDGALRIILLESFDEEELLKGIASFLNQFPELPVYQNSTNRFDELILKGCFINARRPPTKLPGAWAVADFSRLEF